MHTYSDDIDSDDALHWVSVDGLGEDWGRLLRAVFWQRVHLHRGLQCGSGRWGGYGVSTLGKAETSVYMP